MRRYSKFFSHKQNWLGLIIVLIFVAVAIAAPAISPQTPDDLGYFKRVGQFSDLTPHPPSQVAKFGTLPGQFDVFHTLVWGTRNALQFGLLVALLSAFIGIIFGAVSGYAGGIVNNVMMRISDAFLAFPVIAGVVFLQQLHSVVMATAGGTFSLHIPLFLDPSETVREISPIQKLLELVDPLMLSLILFSWMPYARLVNSMVLGLKRMEFVQAARALGASPFRIIGRHLIPNSVSPAIVLAARDVGNVVLLQATLTFIQIGGNSPWGELLARGRNFILGPGGSLLTYWWVYIPATLVVVIFGVSWNLLGDGINDAMDPGSISQIENPFRKGQKEEKGEIEQVSALALTPKKREIDPVLATARVALENKDFECVLHSYFHLVKHNRELNAVIQDLAQVVAQYPREPRLWRLLGHALTRNGEAEDAARAYAQAKKLLH